MPVPPVLTLAERDRRWAGLRKIMAERGVDALIVGSFQGRERLESYLIDDFLDSIVILPGASEPVVLAFATGRISRTFESASRGIDPWKRLNSANTRSAMIPHSAIFLLKFKLSSFIEDIAERQPARTPYITLKR